MFSYKERLVEPFRCASMAVIAVAFCYLVATFPVSGWTLAMMSVVSLVGIAGIIGVEKSDDGQKREG